MNGLINQVDVLIHLCNIFSPFIHWIHLSIYTTVHLTIYPCIIYLWIKHAYLVNLNYMLCLNLRASWCNLTDDVTTCPMMTSLSVIELIMLGLV